MEVLYGALAFVLGVLAVAIAIRLLSTGKASNRGVEADARRKRHEYLAIVATGATLATEKLAEVIAKRGEQVPSVAKLDSALGHFERLLGGYEATRDEMVTHIEAALGASADPPWTRTVYADQRLRDPEGHAGDEDGGEVYADDDLAGYEEPPPGHQQF